MTGTPDTRGEVLAAAHAMAASGHPHSSGGATSDLSIDETLLLHAMGWEPVDLVFGSSMVSVPPTVWQWGQGEIGAASHAHGTAFDHATSHLTEQCLSAGGHGVVGVRVEVEIKQHFVDVELVGTAIRPKAGGKSPSVFASDLSARDFTMLHRAGWRPLGLCFGASFVYAPRRSVGTVLAQKTQNVELTNFTEAMYAARETAMARMQDAAVRLHAAGVVDVVVQEGPMTFAHHAVGFTAWGTAIAAEPGGHQMVAPVTVVSLDDAQVAFEAGSLRGK
ncbi:MAG: heavy metal-binding domain-containing protein [Acidimicrobiales bacterium]